MNTEWKDALTHLRLHFSLLLLPVYLFAISQSKLIEWDEALFTFIVLHLLVYPSSNLYNSYSDRDVGSIGGLKNPPPTNSKMLLLANILDVIAIASTTIFDPELGAFVFLYILSSRLYSNRKVRLKQYALLGFLIIFVFQGAVTYYISSLGSGLYWGLNCILSWSYMDWVNHHIYAMLACSFQIGAIYPLTQIYQHQSDLDDGVKTLSYKLGYRGTFIFSGIFFSLATLFYYFHFNDIDVGSFYSLMIAQIPIVAFFLYWAAKVWKDPVEANFKNTMRMNIIAAAVLNCFFLYLFIK